MKDNYFDELKFTEVLENRMRLAGEADQFVGNYLSKDWVRKNILRQTEDEILEIDKQIAAGGEDEEPMGDEEEAPAQQSGDPQRA